MRCRWKHLPSLCVVPSYSGQNTNHEPRFYRDFKQTKEVKNETYKNHFFVIFDSSFRE